MTPSEDMESLASKLVMIKDSLQQDLLDLLIDGSSSFAALYGSLVRNCGYPSNLDLSLMAEALFQMEELGWIDASQMRGDGRFRPVTEEDRKVDLSAYQSWLPTADFEELSVDEVGLWYEITPAGRGQWKKWFPDEGSENRSQWMIDDLKGTSTIVIHAANLELADQKLRWWLSQNPEIELSENSRKLESVPAFVLRNGTAARSGVKLSYQYEAHDPGSLKASPRT